jgi:Fe-S-cluster-containing hydrogenase component 2
MRASARRSRRRSTKYVRVDAGKCTGCWKCLDECTQGALGSLNLWFHKHVVVRDPEKCHGCKRCIAVCPNGVFEAL